MRTSAFWSDTPSVYGPAFTGISDVVMRVAGTSFTAARLAFQLIGGVSLVASVALLSRKLGWSQSMIVVGLNPLLDTFGLNDAHCDVLIGFAVLAGVLALEGKHYVTSGLSLAFSSLIKISLLPALFGAFVWLWFKVSKRAALIVGISGFTLVALAMALTGGLDSWQALHRASLRHTRFSIWNPVHIVLTDIFGSGLPTHTTADSVVSTLANVAVFSVGLLVLWRSRNNSTVVISVISIILAYQVLGAYTLSWYAAWSIPTLAVTVTAKSLREMKPFVIAMGHGCWLAVSYLSGYAVIVVTLVGAIYGAARYFKTSKVVTS